ncbi:hypothetical protein QR680_000825 [Steinernema hermaphroditum]|uniref:Uncharacterized protein n=1 Tax=Steinernema hermaphroditum TaxID=289476 RepID=A0AA39LEZ8_9BILA|nr:hypothetical protein QR680_000825 [Steinernema hermaphroditum]
MIFLAFTCILYTGIQLANDPEPTETDYMQGDSEAAMPNDHYDLPDQVTGEYYDYGYYLDQPIEERNDSSTSTTTTRSARMSRANIMSDFTDAEYEAAIRKADALFFAELKNFDEAHEILMAEGADQTTNGEPKDPEQKKNPVADVSESATDAVRGFSFKACFALFCLPCCCCRA